MTQPDLPPQPEFSRIVNCEKLPSSGKSYNIEASPEERAALVERLPIDSLESLEAEFSVVPGAGDRILLTGRLHAAIRQTCVVTLEPIESEIDVSIDRTYSASAKPYWGPEDEPDEDGNSIRGGPTKNVPDPLEPLEKGGIDIGEVASEELAIEIDPFPRRHGAELKASPAVSGEYQGEDVKNPFAVLEKLKKKRL